MAAHYGVAITTDANKRAINVVLALWFGDNPALSPNISQPLNATGSPDDPVTHWVGGRTYTDEQLTTLQNLAANMPSATWPVAGIGGSVSEADAIAAATALYTMVGTADTYTSTLAHNTLVSALGALGLKQVIYPDD